MHTPADNVTSSLATQPARANSGTFTALNKLTKEITQQYGTCILTVTIDDSEWTSPFN